MIIDLPSTTSSTINKKMVEMREKGGANAQGRVLTLVIVTDEDSSEDPIAAANGASFEHPCRVIVVAKGSKRGAARLDAQIRVGGDAGASEVIVLRLYGPLADHGAAVVIPLLLADAPVVVWWPGESPEVPALDPIGALAQRRITDSAAVKRPIAALTNRRTSYQPGDTDLAWTRLTNWRGLLAAALDQPPHEKITEATVAGASDSASADLLAGWLALQLRCPVRRIKVDRAGSGLRAVTMVRRSGEVSLIRPEGVTATLSVTNQAPRQLTLPRRILRDCIAEELRRLDADDVYADVLSKGLDLVAKTAAPTAAAPAKAPARARSKPPAGARSRAPLNSAAKATAKATTKAPPEASAKPVAPKLAVTRSVARATSAPDPVLGSVAEEVPATAAAPNTRKRTPKPRVAKARSAAPRTRKKAAP
ncbi:glucose-6-phosphate dehydrogenase assembly protein OpcA [Nakamurella sp. UYEF19]|uniref:glucose-6-phosphate dehydrogenase assembly protein OpcA n=1 Tax=Nakamurella sp. UYEF19 TaxID=1756392 RepID=UPI0033909609